MRPSETSHAVRDGATIQSGRTTSAPARRGYWFAVRTQGLWEASLTAAWRPCSRLSRRLHRWRQRAQDRRFDRRYGVDTAVSLGFPEGSFRDDALPYEPVSSKLFIRMITALDLDCSRYTFVDIGCGKGRALLLAQTSGFAEVIGVELRPELAAAAVANLATFKGPHPRPPAQVLCMHAADYVIPAGRRLVLYLNNPFGLSVMWRILENIRRSRTENAADLYVLYGNPALRAVLAESGVLKQVWSARRYVVYRAFAARVPAPAVAS